VSRVREESAASRVPLSQPHVALRQCVGHVLSVIARSLSDGNGICHGPKSQCFHPNAKLSTLLLPATCVFSSPQYQPFNKCGKRFPVEPRQRSHLVSRPFLNHDHIFCYLKTEVEVEVTLRLTVNRSECLGIEYPCGTCNQMLLALGMLLSEICGLISVRRPL
jgi:hypothetical protein